MRGRCLSWVKSRYWPMSEVSLLYPQQQTFQIQHYANLVSMTGYRDHSIPNSIVLGD
jgi:hypothetical protein